MQGEWAEWIRGEEGRAGSPGGVVGGPPPGLFVVVVDGVWAEGGCHAGTLLFPRGRGADREKVNPVGAIWQKLGRGN